jgi:hypothetical protein
MVNRPLRDRTETELFRDKILDVRVKTDRPKSCLCKKLTDLHRLTTGSQTRNTFLYKAFFVTLVYICFIFASLSKDRGWRKNPFKLASSAICAARHYEKM